MKNAKDENCAEKQTLTILEDETLNKVSDIGETADGLFSELPREQLIGGPLQVAVETQEKSRKTTLDFLAKVRKEGAQEEDITVTK